MINKLPIIGWLLSAIASVSLAVPFWLCWTVFGLGAKYFYWIPDIYQRIPFLDCVGLFIAVAIIKGTLTPKFVDVTQSNENKSK